MDTTLQDPLIGQVLDGRYRVDARIAVGGMATVYRGLDTRLDRELALKVMHPSLASDGVFVERFIREAKSAARLAHHNVVGVFDQGTASGYVYLAMEYISGCTLRDVLRDRGALQPRAALDVLEPVLAALGAAHRAGLVHRDMKPENVLIGDDGRVKVADFGLVRAVDGQTANTDSILGTVSYLAPEVIEEGRADPRSDLYACGVMLHEMLTGSKPHSGGTPAQVIYQHLQQDVPAPSVLVPGLPPELDQVVARAAARDPERRPVDAVALLAEVRTARSGLTDTELDTFPPQAKRQRPSNPEDRTTLVTRPRAGQGAAVTPLPGAPEAESVEPEDAVPAVGEPDAESTPSGTARPADVDTYDMSVRSPLRVESMDDERLNQTFRLSLQQQDDGDGSSGGRSRRRPRWALLALAGALLVTLLGTGVWYINSGQFTKTPAVLDKTEAKAKRELEKAGLNVDVETGFSERVKRGHVISTDPAPGERIRNTGTVTLRVSRGPNIVKVPDLTGVPLVNAKRQLADAGLKTGQIQRKFDDQIPRGSVISSEPGAGGKKRPDSAVALTVSKGEPVDVPDVVGDSEDDAREELTEAGFKVEVAKRRVFSTEDEGNVARQSPTEGSVRAEGETVTLTLSKGPDMVTVPSVKDQSLDEARGKLESAGFKVTVRRIFVGEKVFSQSPGGEEKAPRGSEVTIWLR
ncbi:Stk1 family PASTA domain-containing Ser/Thr kinase [Streptomyces sp. AJS327]|uniref:Stk1 family PASTA domain-containing Ser/Thr kinase n=1 Tax=Streptomyces sp. AJS327 TaxID=2545265 RepID=UPI0015DF5184|nr:Stk1 family PASTA domain-containing Ser/Thr kinase [Streptomyces sp. AJS327]MBA0050309.1 Stk1 family PASTA domain-containing Ser/Thr kinase [Streptomyces sp. AJS327]